MSQSWGSAQLVHWHVVWFEGQAELHATHNANIQVFPVLLGFDFSSKLYFGGHGTTQVDLPSSHLTGTLPLLF